jgi:CHAT domain-containing protein
MQYDLAFAERESLAVAGANPDARVFLRKEATVGAFVRHAGAFSQIHLATHGRFDSAASFHF